ncbi:MULTISPECIES: cytochrome c [unclassified Duganella]|uniref:c-type cytochrome n=1 Tax=unclassified Duganella TaxID=2636909 RepID=UPI0008823A95|nr:MULTISPECIES: cytochrome c [unclassified Duganella]SDH16461.1 Cytochrome c, mono-and diheme variants [Duganella sp. OV458]SDK30952.1 Cytochrome c, mono-and diheme variants [Duganella sp. OV510]
MSDATIKAFSRARRTGRAWRQAARVGALTLLLAAASAPLHAQDAAGGDGKSLFLKNCAACHQQSGKGIPGAFPALANSKFVQGQGSEVAAVLLKGRGGMPDFSESLSDREIATVLTFVRSSWGNKADGLSEADVGTLRTALGVEAFGNTVMSNKH